MARIASWALGCLGVVLPVSAWGADPKDQPQYDQAAVAATLEETPGAAAAKRTEKAGSPLEVPPPPPRKKGFVLETSIGAMGFLGKLKNVSPTASMLHMQLGYEPFRWLMAFVEGDIAFTSTRYIEPSRGYAIYGMGGGARITARFSERVAGYVQGDLGVMETSSDLLHTYGFYDAENWNLYFGGMLGLEWYQINPHYALALNGGARKTPGFERTVGSDPAISWLGGVAIRYTF
jgi:hypothetical protein